MKNQTWITFFICLILGIIYTYFSYYVMSRSSQIWGMYGIPALISGVFFSICGVMFVFMRKTKGIGKGFLLAGVTMILIGSSICNGYLRI